MKINLQEFAHCYEKYLFGYTLHALREENDIVDELFEKGFLPFTGNTEIKDTYYMARSSRVNLEKFTLSSENRRVQKKMLSVLIKTRSSASGYTNDEVFLNFCLEYFIKRHGPNIFSKERLQFILAFSKELFVLKYENQQGEIMAYVIEAAGNNTAHYWFSFYNMNPDLPSFGVWLMLDGIIGAKEKNIQYYYLGTIYGEKALYKTNFNALEYWNGNEWVQNITELKRIARQDKEREIHL